MDDDPIGALVAVVPPLVQTLEALGQVSRYLAAMPHDVSTGLSIRNHLEYSRIRRRRDAVDGDACAVLGVGRRGVRALAIDEERNDARTHTAELESVSRLPRRTGLQHIIRRLSRRGVKQRRSA